MIEENTEIFRNIEYPNEKATIGFIISYPFQFYIYKNVYKHLKTDAEFIIDLGVFFPVRQPTRLLEEIIRLLEKYGASYRVLHYEDYHSSEYIRFFLSRYKCLISPWEFGCAGQVSYAPKAKRIHLMYGCAKELTFVRPSKRIYDLSLAFGERGNKLLSFYTPSVITGNARFDDWFLNSVDLKEISLVTESLDPKRKTLLYLPTHGDLSSLDALSDHLGPLTEQYNLLIKLHYFTLREEPDRVERINHIKGAKVLGDDVDILPVLKVADAVISDNSSAIFEAILADRPILVTDFVYEKFLDTAHRERRFIRRGKVGATTYSGSLEQEIKQKGTVVVLKSVDDLQEKLNETLEDQTKYKNARKEIVKENFSFNDGHCGERAARKVRECMEAQETERPILWHAYDAHQEMVNAVSIQNTKRMEEKINLYSQAVFSSSQQIKETPFFSVIVLDEGSRSFQETLRTLVWQQYPESRYEIIIVTKSPRDKVLSLLSNETPQKAIPEISIVEMTETKNLSSSVHQCVRQAKGELLVFTKSDFVIPHDWLLLYSIWFQKLPDTIGIGGYDVLLNENQKKNSFENYRYYRIAQQLGLEKVLFNRQELYWVENNHFYQNPFGILSNAAFRKSLLEKMNWNAVSLSSSKILEVFLKYYAIKEGKIGFIPMAVTRLSEGRYSDFRAENIDYGMAMAILSDQNIHLKKLALVSFRQLLKEMINCIFEVPPSLKVSLVSLIFLAHVFQLIGYYFYRIYTSLEKMKYKISHEIEKKSAS